MDLRTGSRHVCTPYPRLDRFALGRPPLFAARWPSATGLTSYLSGCLGFTGQRSHFQDRRRFGGFSPALPKPGVPPTASVVLPRLAAALSWQRLFSAAPGRRPVLARDSNRAPSG
jgi:hypothetical protein